MLRALFTGACVALAAACYSTPMPNCTFQCGPMQECPANYGCSNADNICHLMSGNTLLACEVADAPPRPPDAPPPPPDAPSTPPPDAPMAMPDAPPPPPDAPLPMPDSPPPPPPDAPRPDAAPAPDA